MPPFYHRRFRRLHSFRLPNRGDIVILGAFVISLSPPWNIGDVAPSGIIAFYSEFYSEFYFGFYSGLPPPVSLVPVFAGPPNHGDTGF